MHMQVWAGVWADLVRWLSIAVSFTAANCSTISQKMRATVVTAESTVVAPPRNSADCNCAQQGRGHVSRWASR